MSEKIMPCPFCGAPGKVDRPAVGFEQDGWAIRCPTEGCMMLTSTARTTEHDAIAAWNHRAADPRIEKAREALEDIACDIEHLARDTGAPAMRFADRIREALAALEVE